MIFVNRVLLVLQEIQKTHQIEINKNMSTQFRSRIKTVIDYGQNESATGGCCLPDGSKLENTTIIECNTQNGFFRQGEAANLPCPDRGLTGCCCACSYVREQDGDFEDFIDMAVGENPLQSIYYNQDTSYPANTGGIKDNITQCECNSLKGKWFYGKCEDINSIAAFCGSVVSGTDVRMPAACCHSYETIDETIVECTNVCTNSECSAYYNEGFSNVYYGTDAAGSGAICSQPYNGIDPPNCSESLNPQGRQQQATESSIFDEVFPCFTLEVVDGVYTHKCSQRTPKECYDVNGFQYPRYSDSTINLCSDSTVYTPSRGKGSLRVTPPSAPSSAIPEIGTAFQGGIFAGVFEPGVSTISRRTKKGTEILAEKSRRSGNGTNKKKWAIIYSFRPYGDYTNTNDFSRYKKRMVTTSEKYIPTPTSFYDGFYNTYGDGGSFSGISSILFSEIRSYVKYGFSDWYVPSIDELSFIFKNQSLLFTRNERLRETVSRNYMRNLYGPIEFSNMMSSTLYTEKDNLGISYDLDDQIIGSRGYLYAQNMSGSTINNNGLIYKADRRQLLVVPLCRRIYLD